MQTKRAATSQDHPPEETLGFWNVPHPTYSKFRMTELIICWEVPTNYIHRLWILEKKTGKAAKLKPRWSPSIICLYSSDSSGMVFDNIHTGFREQKYYHGSLL